MDVVVLVELLGQEGFQAFLVLRDVKVKRDFLVTVVKMVLLVHLVAEVTGDHQDTQAPLGAEKVVLNLMGLTSVL